MPATDDLGNRDGGSRVTTRQTALGPHAGPWTGDPIACDARCARGEHARSQRLGPIPPKRRPHEHCGDEPLERRCERIPRQPSHAGAAGHRCDARANRVPNPAIE